MAFNQSQQMKKEFRLPMVPGMSCGEETLRRNYHRSHVVGPRLDASSKVDGVPPDMTYTNTSLLANTVGGGKSLNGTAAEGGHGSTYAAGDATIAKTLTGHVLRFYGYTIEQVPESAQEVERVRRVVLHFFLEDGTISATEPREDNSGIEFRSNLKRHLVPLADGTPINLNHLRIGEPITFYGRTYLIYDADPFTRNFFHELGEELPAAVPVPDDQYTQMRSRPVAKPHDVLSIAASSALNIMLTPDQVRATQRFLEHDRKVLRCDCTWDDTESLHGYKHFLTLYYFLADGSIGVVEKDTQNSGRDPFPNFFRRQRIAKPTDPTGKFDSTFLGSLTFTENKDTQYYTDEDIRIGNVLNLYGRKIKIHGYNEYTKEHLEKTFGVADHKKLRGSTPPPFRLPGTERRQQSDQQVEEGHQKKVEEVHRRRFEGSVVKFLLRMDNQKYEDEIRRFVLAVYPADNSISMFEPVIRNSGIVGGKFLQRQKVKKPDGSFYTADDFFIGARVVINAFPFVVLNSDPHSLNYMENYTENFSRSDINRIVRKLQAMLRSKQTGLPDAFRRADEQNHSGLEMSVFLSIMSDLGLNVSEQEILTVLRFFDKNNESYVSYEEVAARILPEGAVLAGDDRPWEEIYEESQREETAAFVTDPSEERRKKELAEEVVAAARGAEEFRELFSQRRKLFMKELLSITDYARDSLIGADELKMCVRQKLGITTISSGDLNAFCAKLFPPSFPRVSYEEFIKLLNGTSSLPHNLDQIIAMVSK